MSSIITSSLPQFGVPPMPVRRFSVAEYHRLIDTGILTEDDPVELLEGWIVARTPHRPLHDGTVQRVSTLRRRLPTPWELRIKSSVTTDDSEPEPDVAVVRGDGRTFMQNHPGPTDIEALIEVAESSVSRDRQVKGRLYARARISAYWIVNLVDGCVEVYTDPDSAAATPAYRTRTDYRPGDQIPLVLDGQTVATLPVADLLP